MNAKKIVFQLALTLSLSLSAALTFSARADTYTWANQTVSGTWNATDTSVWNLGGVNPAYAPGISGTTGDADVVLGNGTDALTVTIATNGFPSNSSFLVNSLTVNRNTTFILPGGNRAGFTDNFTNLGLVRVTGGRNLSKVTGSIVAFLLTNSGTLAVDAGALTLSATVANTGGLLTVASGAAIDFRSAWGISGGAVEVAAGGRLFTDNVNTSLAINNVAINNAGLWEVADNNASNHAQINTVSGGALVNTGTVRVLQTGYTTGNLTRSITGFVFKDGAAFTNSGRLEIINSNTTPTQFSHASDTDLYGRVTFENTAGNFINNGLITVTNSGSTAMLGNFVQDASLRVGDGAKFSNSGTISVSLGAGVADDAQHYAALTVSTDWTNNGTVLIDGANKTAAKAKLDLGANNYTQTGAAAAVQLKNGGQLKAGSVNLNGGKLTVSGGGEILAASVVLGSGALWEITDLGADVLSVSGDLSLSGVTLSLNGSVSDGNWLLANYAGSLLDNTLTVSGLPAGFDYLLDTSAANKLYLNITAIPEPSVWALTVAGGALLLALRRCFRREKP